ncbi:peptidoglycan recognition protein 1-like isoform X1 [Bombyx mandarina]|uniref:Peptidoglycan recognition protein n=1 Tax=Bombyx mandarina TaxID=7092 RepID=A0A6J2JRH4_BOMMA|nr:peptidoglycan recognition protein 1-like isoform X1 [Bombyx mandarina]
MIGDENPKHETKSPPPISSDVAVVDDRIMAVATQAASSTPISQLNVTKSSRVHIGPKFISVTQTVRNTEEIKELPLPRFIWKVLKNTSRVERSLCAAAVSALIICIALTLYFTLSAKATTDDDVAPHPWNISRDMWLAKKYNGSEAITQFVPLRLVIVQHTVSAKCSNFITCAAEVRIIQTFYLEKQKYDIPYNFIIGNDNRVYEGRGWGIMGAHTLSYNSCSVGVAFIGDYRELEATDLQINRTQMLLDDGVRRGFLHPDYYIVGACDIRETVSPGINLYNALKKLKHFDHSGRFKHKTCTQIYAMIESEN